MKGLMSLWTGTTAFHLNRGCLLVSTLANHLAAEAFDRVEFVTDRLGAEIAERLGWKFTEVITELDALEIATTKQVWALGKLVALSIQYEPVCQLDFDVFLHKPLPEDLLSAKTFAQSPDYDHYYQSVAMMRAIGHANLPFGHQAYNCGIIGGTDTKLLRDYATGGIELANRFRKLRFFDEGTTISMAVEQYWLGVFAQWWNFKPRTLLPLCPTREEWHKVGYTHLHGDSKRNPYYLAKVKRRLAEQFPKAFVAFEDGFKQLEKDERFRGKEPLGGDLV